MYDPNNLNGIREVDLYHKLFPEAEGSICWNVDRGYVRSLYVELQEGDPTWGFLMAKFDRAEREVMFHHVPEPVPRLLQRLLCVGFDLTHLVIKT